MIVDVEHTLEDQEIEKVECVEYEYIRDTIEEQWDEILW